MTTLPCSVPHLRCRVPSRVQSTISRARLLDVLDDTDKPVTLLIAPAGSGKTMLLIDWITTRRDRSQTAVAWVTIDESDNDLDVLRSSVKSAFSQCGSPAVADAVASVPSFGEPDYENFSARLVEALESVDEHIVLVLDDAHLVVESDVLAVVGNLLHWPPTNVRTIVAGRFEPPLALQKLRLNGTVHDLARSDIAFTADEAAVMLGEHGIALDPANMSAIMNRTEGWAAGLRLASMALDGGSDHRTVIDGFTGSSHSVADYLVSEVLDGLPSDTRRFLTETSVPAWFTPELAEQLTGDDRASETIDMLMRRNFLIEQIPGPQPTYRYHPLMRSYLRAEILRLGSAQVRSLESVASSWFTGYQQPLQALEHSVHAGDRRSIEAIIDRWGLSMVLDGHGAAVLALVDAMPSSIAQLGSLRLLCAAAYLSIGNHATAVSTLTALRRTVTTPLSADTDRRDRNAELLRRALEVQASLHTGSIGATLSALRALDVGCSGSPELDAFALLMGGSAEMHLGKIDDAERSFADALDHARGAKLHRATLAALSAQAGLSFMTMSFEQSVQRSRAAVLFAEAHGLGESTLTTLARSTRSLVATLRMEDSTDDPWPDLAVSPEPGIVDYGRRAGWAVRGQPIVGTTATIGQAVVGSTGTVGQQNSSKRTTAPDARAWLDYDRPVVPAMEAVLAPMVQRNYVAAGEMLWAAEIVNVTARRLGRIGEVAFLTAEMHRLHGRLDAAEAELESIHRRRRPCASPVTKIRALLASATIAHSRRHTSRAFELVTEALEAAQPENVLLPFAEAGEVVRDVLTRNHGRFAAMESFADRARKCIPHSGQGAKSRTGSVLTPRELELLRELPSWRTAEQIASDHFVSVNTVKTHLRGIYRKLDVRSRRDAISAAQDLGLL